MAMEKKRCEFCKALRPVVFCNSDAAHLCLSCDAKVHSANALSYRHPRTLVCESCTSHQALLRCFDHQMFLCQSCDITHHASLDHHEKMVISCYVGCPSAKDLAQLWGFDNEEFQLSSEVANDDSKKKRSYLILQQQILDLKRLQLCDNIYDSCSEHVKERSHFRDGATWKEHTMFERQPLEHSGGALDSRHMVGKSEETLPSPFPQLENLPSNNGNAMNGDNSFWQYNRSPLHNNEIWLQNMQDLGVCDEVQCFEDVNIPDVDLTFRNFEELFGNEHETCSFEDHPPSYETMEHGDDIGQLVHQPMPPYPRTALSSFSMSRIAGESSGSHCNDDGLSPRHVSWDLVTAKKPGGEEGTALRYKESKVSRNERRRQYTSPRAKSEFKKRGDSSFEGRRP